MVITDLKKICPRCQGSGNQPGFSVLGVNQINYHGRCPICRGRGFTLTELGQDLLTLFKPFVQEWMEEERKLFATPPGKKPAPGEPTEEEA